MQNDFDFIVVGGGIAGLVAAVRVADAGHRVLVLERSKETHYSCNSRFGSGALHLAFSDMTDDPDLIFSNMHSATGGYGDQRLLRAIADQSRSFVNWLVELGIRFEKGGPMKHRNWVLTPQRAQVGGVDWRDRGGDRLLTALEAKLTSAGSELQRGARAGNLLINEQGACCGVSAAIDGQNVSITAHRVLLADGGFGSNRTRVAQYIAPDADKIVMRNAGANHGDALQMAQDIGAQTTELHHFYGHVMHAEADEKPLLSPYPFMDFLAVRTIVVNTKGLRIADEGISGIFIANALARSPEADTHVVVVDNDCWENHGKDRLIPPNPNFERGNATIFIADTLEQLAANAGIDPKGLSNTVSAYNQAIEQDTLTTLSPPRSDLPYAPHAILKPPFRAIPARAGLSYSMGGLEITPTCQVSHRNGDVIQGLFAAGDTVGGIEGGDKAGYIGGLALAGITAMIASNNIIEDLG